MMYDRPIAHPVSPEPVRLVGERALARPEAGMWSARRRLAFIVAASAGLWAGIALAASAILR